MYDDGMLFGHGGVLQDFVALTAVPPKDVEIPVRYVFHLEELALFAHV
jgi:hypothetical protein